MTSRNRQQDAMPSSSWKHRLWRFTMMVTLVMWWGGLTFYSAIVVPLGIEQIGGTEQGLLTQRVTIRLNIVGTIVGSLLLIDALWRKPRNHQAVAASALLGMQAWLWFMHTRLSRLLDTASLSEVSGDSFYHEHRIYLWVTAAQWLVGLASLWILSVGAADNSSKERPI